MYPPTHTHTPHYTCHLQQAGINAIPQNHTHVASQYTTNSRNSAIRSPISRYRQCVSVCCWSFTSLQHRTPRPLYSPENQPPAACLSHLSEVSRDSDCSEQNTLWYPDRFMHPIYPDLIHATSGSSSPDVNCILGILTWRSSLGEVLSVRVCRGWVLSMRVCRSGYCQ